MRILLTKLNDERHALEIERGDGRRERVELETRSTLLHDLTHFAVEQAAGIDHGFFGALASGSTLAELGGRTGKDYGAVMLEVERTVAVLQKMVRSDEPPAAVHARIVDLLRVQGETPPPWFTLALVTDVRERMRRLFGRWKATPYGTALELIWTRDSEKGSRRS